jgi:hypothetical protein
MQTRRERTATPSLKTGVFFLKVQYNGSAEIIGDTNADVPSQKKKYFCDISHLAMPGAFANVNVFASDQLVLEKDSVKWRRGQVSTIVYAILMLVHCYLWFCCSWEEFVCFPNS